MITRLWKAICQNFLDALLENSQLLDPKHMQNYSTVY